MIRSAKREDLPQVTLWAYSGLQELGLDPDYKLVKRKVYQAFDLAPCIIIEGKGFAGLTTTNDYWSGEQIISDYQFYLELEHRNLKNLQALCKAAQGIADHFKRKLNIQFIGLEKPETRMRLMRLCGFETVAFIGEYNGKQGR